MIAAPAAFLVYGKGFLIGASLLVVIGSQNAHVLRMGLCRQHVLATVLVCAACDTLLITLGITGLGLAIASNPLLLQLIKYAGAAFLFYYGCRSWRAAFQHDKMAIDGKSAVFSLRQAITAVLAMSLLNPHVYLDTVMLVGSVGAQESGDGKFYFGVGAVSASIVWFFALGYGARLLTPVFAKPLAWKILDLSVAGIVWLIALTLLF